MDEGMLRVGCRALWIDPIAFHFGRRSSRDNPSNPACESGIRSGGEILTPPMEGKGVREMHESEKGDVAWQERPLLPHASLQNADFIVAV